MKYDLVIFDLDGTILNTLDDLADSCNEVLKHNNLPEHTKDEIKFMVGNGIPKLIQRAVPADTDTVKYQKVYKEFLEYYDAHRNDKTAPYPGLVNAFASLKKKGVILAVNTNKNQQISEELCEQYYPGVFSVIAGNSDRPVKPDPAGVNAILAATGIKKERTLYVGDSDVDCQTAKNSGIDFIGVDWGFRGEAFLRANGAKKVVKICEDLVNSIE